MENKNAQVKKHNWGYELIWCSTETYCGKIIVFETPVKLNFVYSDSIARSFFVNSGDFKFYSIETSTGNIIKYTGQDGSVFNVDVMTPYSIECVSKNGSISEVNNGELNRKNYIVIRQEDIDEIS